MKRWLLRITVLVSIGIGSYFFGYARGDTASISEEQKELEEQFTHSMTNVVLKGEFTMNGRKTDPTVERYTIERVEKMAGDIWLFHARIEYGKTDVTLPVPVKLLWAGDTPVVTLTEAPIPGLGTFSVRLLFYKNSYTGLWSSPKNGGFQFGEIINENHLTN